MENLAYQDPIWEELIDGKVVAMSPRPTINHSIIATNIQNIFAYYLKGNKCIPFSDGVDLYLSEKDRVIPDMMVVCNRDIIKKDGVYGAPDLVVEVLSPSTTNRDRGYKKDLYERSGVKEYWIVSPLERSVEVYLLKDTKYVLDHVYVIHPDYELEKMNEAELAEIQTEFKCSLYDDLDISIQDIFHNTFN